MIVDDTELGVPESVEVTVAVCNVDTNCLTPLRLPHALLAVVLGLRGKSSICTVGDDFTEGLNTGEDDPERDDEVISMVDESVNEAVIT